MKIVHNLQEKKNKFMELYENHYTSMVMFFVKRGTPREEAEDLAQEVFTRSWNYFESFDWNSGNENYWIFSIARNLYKNHLRTMMTKKRAGETVSLDPVDYSTPDGSQNQEENFIAVERLETIKEIVAQLPKRTRTVFVLYYFKQIKIREISKTLNIKPGTVKSQLSFARQRIADHIKDGV